MRWGWLACCLAVASSTCGGSATTPVNPPTTSPTTTFTPAPNQPVVTITANGVSPQQAEIAVGGRAPRAVRQQHLADARDFLGPASDPHRLSADERRRRAIARPDEADRRLP